MLRKKQQPYIPKPIGIWELSKSSLTDDPTTDMLVTKNDIGIDPLWTPAGFLGSPLIGSWKPLGNTPYSHLIVDYKTPRPSWAGITIMFWLRFDDKVMPTENNILLVINNITLKTWDFNYFALFYYFIY